MLDNVDVAVLTKVNELAERYGLKPYDFVATFRGAENKYTLSISSVRLPACQEQRSRIGPKSRRGPGPGALVGSRARVRYD